MLRGEAWHGRRGMERPVLFWRGKASIGKAGKACWGAARYGTFGLGTAGEA